MTSNFDWTTLEIPVEAEVHYIVYRNKRKRVIAKQYGGLSKISKGLFKIDNGKHMTAGVFAIKTEPWNTIYFRFEYFEHVVDGFKFTEVRAYLWAKSPLVGLEEKWDILNRHVLANNPDLDLVEDSQKFPTSL